MPPATWLNDAGDYSACRETHARAADPQLPRRQRGGARAACRLRNARSQPRRLCEPRRSARRSRDRQALRAVRRRQGSAPHEGRVSRGARGQRAARATRRRAYGAGQGGAQRRAQHSLERDLDRYLRGRGAALGFRSGARSCLARRARDRRGERRAHGSQQPPRAPPEIAGACSKLGPMPGPLAGIRVLDLTPVLAGPWAAQNLADLGAEVIKVERPKKGDDSRAFGPPWLKDAQGGDTGESAYFACANRGKKSLTLDLAQPQGQAIARELAARCDVLLENFKYGDLDRYGLGYAQLKGVNPALIYCSVTGFGHTGPWRERPGYDFMIQGMGGLMSITGERDDRPGGGPQKAGIPIADLITGMY